MRVDQIKFTIRSLEILRSRLKSKKSRAIVDQAIFYCRCLLSIEKIPYPKSTDKTISWSRYSLDLLAKTLTIFDDSRSHVIPLTTLQVGIMEVFLRSEGYTATIETILKRAWNHFSSPTENDINTVRAAMSRLRQKLTSTGANVTIKYVRDVGYKLFP